MSPTSLGSCSLWGWGWCPLLGLWGELDKRDGLDELATVWTHGLYLTHTVAVLVVVVIWMDSYFVSNFHLLK